MDRERIPEAPTTLPDWLIVKVPNITVTEHVRWLHGIKRQLEVELNKVEYYTGVVYRSRILIFFTSALFKFNWVGIGIAYFFRFRPNCRFLFRIHNQNIHDSSYTEIIFRTFNSQTNFDSFTNTKTRPYIEKKQQVLNWNF